MRLRRRLFRSTGGRTTRRIRQWTLGITTLLLVVGFGASPARAQACGSLPAPTTQAPADPLVDTIYLRKACGSLPNCAEDNGTAGCGLPQVNTWLWGTPEARNPSATNRVVVDIGPGVFHGRISCPFPIEGDGGHTTFRGSGRTTTKIEGSFGPGIFFDSFYSAVTSGACDDLEFRDMAFSIPGQGTTIYWIGGGNSSWTDVDVTGSNVWYDVCPFAFGGDPWEPPMGDHDWFGSRLTATSYGYLAGCGMNRFFGSEIHLDEDGLGGLGALVITHRGEVELHGSTIRVTTGNATGTSAEIVGVSLGGGPTGNPAGYGDLRIFGGIMSIDTSGVAGADAVGVWVTAVPADPAHTADGVSLETLDTAFILKPGAGGTADRIRDDIGGIIRSPFLWQSGADPATDPRLSVSAEGQDAFVETDCLSNGTCGADCEVDTCEPHLMVYRENCDGTGIGGPWWDTATKACRVP